MEVLPLGIRPLALEIDKGMEKDRWVLQMAGEQDHPPLRPMDT